MAIRTRVNTKVESSFSQVPVSSLVHGSLGPSRRTRSKQKRLGDLVEREREGQGLFHYSLFYVVVCCYFLELMSDYFLCSPSVSQTLRKAEANHLVKMWYGFPLFVPSVVFFHPFLQCYLLVMPLCLLFMLLYLFFFRRKFLLPRLVGLWRKKWLQLHPKVWKRRPPVVALLRRPVSQCKVSRLSRILRLSNFLHPNVPNPSRLLVPSKLCYLRWG